MAQWSVVQWSDPDGEDLVLVYGLEGTCTPDESTSSNADWLLRKGSTTYRSTDTRAGSRDGLGLGSLATVGQMLRDGATAHVAVDPIGSAADAYRQVITLGRDSGAAAWFPRETLEGLSRTEEWPWM